MGKKWYIPSVADEWMTDEIRLLLEAIKGRHCRKMRDSVVIVANAVASGQPLKPVFKLSRVCASATWYRKWRRDPIVWAAYEKCLQRALSFRDEETASWESHWAAVRKRNLAEKAAAAPIALAAVMADPNERGAARIEAATRLLKFSDPALGQVQTGGGGAVPVDVEVKLDQEIMAALKGLGVTGGDND